MANPTSMLNVLNGTETSQALVLGTGTTIGGIPVDSTTKLVATTSTSISITAAAHSGRTLVLNSTHTVTCTLPVSTGGGDVYQIVVGVTGTDGSKIVQVANGTDIVQGASVAANTQSTTLTFLSSATSDTVTMNNTTQGGLIGSTIVIRDITAGTYIARVETITTGNPATPFSAAVS